MRVKALLLFAIILALLAALGISNSDQAQAAPDLKMEKTLAALLLMDSHAQAVWAEQNRIGLDASRQSVRVIIELKNSADYSAVAGQLGALQGRVESQSGRLMRALVPIRSLRGLASLENISFIRRPLTARALKLAENRGVLQTGAHLLHSYGFQGAGALIAVIDGGFKGLSDAMRAGDLPGSSISETFDYTGDGLEADTEHGLEVAQIVHEMAPGAQLVLMRVLDEVDLDRAVTDAIQLGAKIISHSIGWFDSNFGDGRGLIDEIARKADAAGILWVNAAGNQAQRHWMGHASDSDGDQWAEFGPDLESIEIWTAFPGLIDLVLVWEDWPVSYQDYDFFLTDWKDDVVASSEEDQIGLAPPRELITYFAERPGTYKIKVKARRVSKPVRIKIFSMEDDLFPFVSEGSVMAPADCICAVAVGAVSLFQWEAGLAESFSAQGPTSDGRIKPDLMAPDRIRDFPGTSASAPHVAGAAAVLLSQHPRWGAGELRQALEAQTRDIYDVGKDNKSGFGQMQLHLGEPLATRRLSAARVRPGESVEVTLTARMPAAQFGTLEWVEKIPKAFVIADIETSGGQVEFQRDPDPMIIRWHWTALGPGDQRQATYRLLVPATASAARYSLEGQLNGQAVAGAATLDVLSKTQLFSLVKNRLATPRITAGAIRFWGDTARQLVIHSMRVELFSLDGQPLADTGFAAPHMTSIWLNPRWTNGVYLYRLTLLGFSGEVLAQEIKKLVLLR